MGDHSVVVFLLEVRVGAKIGLLLERRVLGDLMVLGSEVEIS